METLCSFSACFYEFKRAYSWGQLQVYSDIRILVFWSDSTWCSSCRRNVSQKSTLFSWHILLFFFTWLGNENTFSL